MKAITTKYHGPTNFKGSRVSASAEGGHKLWMQWDDALNSSENHERAAIALAKRLDWDGQWVEGWTEHGSVWVNIAYGAPSFAIGKRSTMTDLISAALLAKRSGLHRTTVLARCKAGKIPGAIRLGRDWLVPVGTVLEPAGTGGWPKNKPRKETK